MSDREKARRALKVLDRVDQQRREQLRLQRELRRTLQEQAYESRRRPSPPGSFATCAHCGGEFRAGDEMREYLDDDGTIVARYHLRTCAR